MNSNIEIQLQWAMFNFDIAVVILFLIISLFWKEQRLGLIVGAMIYLFFTLLWHIPIDWSNLY